MLGEIVVDKGCNLCITKDLGRRGTLSEKWLERANTAFRIGVPEFHIPIADVFFCKSAILARFGVDIPILAMEAMLKDEGLI